MVLGTLCLERDNREVRELDGAITQLSVVFGFIETPTERFGIGRTLQSRPNLPGFDGEVQFVDRGE